ncbi:MAG: MBL fold metallo-hydrolase, partial [Myxococcales bacterium]|nr:MBL fold metallo-hydrolase [Myxococcales bacterium]
DHLVAERLVGLEDGGTRQDLGGSELIILPAHFLHSAGNFQVYDSTSKILYSGDLGASVGIEYRDVKDFDAHLSAMEGFHRRYMTTNRAMAAWAKMVRTLDIDVIAPQHGACFRGKAMVERFIEWCATLECGVDLLPEYRVPER